MFLLSRPDDAFVRNLLKSQINQPFSYEPVGCTRTRVPAAVPNFTMDRNRICLGNGAAVFQKAVEALKQWRMFDLAWLSIRPGRERGAFTAASGRGHERHVDGG